MKNMNNNKISITVVIALIASLMTIGIISFTNTVSAQLSSEDQSYNTGFDDARTDCYQTHTCWGYYHSTAFENHSPDYRDGYTSIVDWYYHKDFRYCDHAVYDCSGNNDYDHDAVNQHLPLTNTNTNNEAYSNNGNKNIDTTNTATDTTQKTDTTQNVVNTPTIICKGICNIPNIQSVSSNTGTTSDDNITPGKEPLSSEEADGNGGSNY